jgi:hypothetical protein
MEGMRGKAKAEGKTGTGKKGNYLAGFGESSAAQAFPAPRIRVSGGGIVGLGRAGT